MQTSRRASCQRTSAGGEGGGEEGEESVAASYLLLEHAHTRRKLWIISRKCLSLIQTSPSIEN